MLAEIRLGRLSPATIQQLAGKRLPTFQWFKADTIPKATSENKLGGDVVPTRMYNCNYEVTKFNDNQLDSLQGVRSLSITDLIH